MADAILSGRPAPVDWLDGIATGLRAYVVLGVLAVVAALPGLARLPPLDRDESRFAQATVQMLETGDYVRLYVQEDPRHKKPVGIHWLQAAMVSAVSEAGAREIWAYRLPSVLGAVIAVLAAFWGGSALIGRPAAFAGAALLSVTLLLSTEAMIAKTDAMLCGLTTLACAAIARLRAEGGGRGLALIAWGAVGAGILIKGPITPMVAGLMVGALLLLEKDRAWAKPLAHPVGPALAALIAAPWLIAIGIATEGAFFREAIGGDLAPKLSGGGEHPFTPPGVHLALLPFLIFPATLGLLPGLALLARGFRAEGPLAAKVLLAWAGPAFLVFELMPTKLAHYPLPVYPALALACGAGLFALAEPAARRLRWASFALTGLAAFVMVGLCAYLATLALGGEAAGDRRAFQTALSGGAMALAFLVTLVLARAPAAWTALAVAAGLVTAVATRERLAPEARTVLVSTQADAALRRADLHPGERAGSPLIVSGYREPSLVFATRTDTQLLDGAAAGRDAQPGQAILIEARERAAFDAAIAARGLTFLPVGAPVEGLNYSNGDAVTLTLGVVEGEPASRQ